MITTTREDAGPGMEHSSRAVVRHYEQLDRFYRQLWGEHVHHGLWETGRESPAEAVELLVRRVADRACIGSGDRVCDAGCGYGATARWLVRERGARVTAVTVTPAQHRYAVAATEGDNPAYLLRDWLAGGLAADSFDAVLAIESIEHMADPRQALVQARRVLRPGGRLVACVWAASAAPSAMARRRLLGPIRREGRLAWLPTEAELRRTVREAGLEVLTVADLSHSVRRTWSVCLRRLGRALLLRPDYRRFLVSSSQSERVFALTMVRIWLAYRLESMRYLMLTARRP